MLCFQTGLRGIIDGQNPKHNPHILVLERFLEQKNQDREDIVRLAGCFDIRLERSGIEMASLGFDARLTVVQAYFFSAI
jgi:hypothetical protein